MKKNFHFYFFSWTLFREAFFHPESMTVNSIPSFSHHFFLFSPPFFLQNPLSSSECLALKSSVLQSTHIGQHSVFDSLHSSNTQWNVVIGPSQLTPLPTKQRHAKEVFAQFWEHFHSNIIWRLWNPEFDSYCTKFLDILC